MLILLDPSRISENQPLSTQIQQFPWTYSVQFSSVAQLCLTLCSPMDCSMPDFPVHHQLPDLTQTHVHGDSNAEVIKLNEVIREP